MKIEKINENQIRCTITNDDLAIRHIKISELAYGSDKARSLFKEMMEEASISYGFEAGETPLVIEAVPISAECIVLTITKVDDPEELDARFSKFAPSVHENDGNDSDDDSDSIISSEVMDLFKRVQKSDADFLSDITKSESKLVSESPSKKGSKKENKPELSLVSSATFTFESLDLLIRFAHVANSFTLCENSLFKDTKEQLYYLMIYNRDITAKDFNRLCNAASEYGHSIKQFSSEESYFKEHFELIIDKHALQSLVEI